jgi:arylsulfatase A-like enzyme
MPNAQGFDYFYGTPRFNGFTVLVDDTSMRSPIFRNQEVVVESVEDWDHITADYTHEAIDWIKANRERPFFLYLAHNMPHIPLGASENFKGKSAGGFYDDTIEEIDWSCGEIFKTLKELSIDDNTLVVFTSDNGPWVETTRGMQPGGVAFIPRDHSGNADPLRGWKMSAWDGGCRVPFIARWPGKIPAGWSSDEILSMMDLLPTFASIAKGELPEVELDGQDATKFLMRQSKTSPRDEYFYYSGCLLTGVRSGDFIGWDRLLACQKYGENDRLEAYPTIFSQPQRVLKKATDINAPNQLTIAVLKSLSRLILLACLSLIMQSNYRRQWNVRHVARVAKKIERLVDVNQLPRLGLLQRDYGITDSLAFSACNRLTEFCIFGKVFHRICVTITNGVHQLSAW